MRVLSQRYTNLPMPAFPRIVYWVERVGSWWPGLDRACPSCIGGYLDATPPFGSVPGFVACIHCGREAAEVQERRPKARVALADEPVRIGRPPKMGRPVGTVAGERHRCAGCTTMIEADHERCRPCHNAHRARMSGHGRLVEILKDGQPHRRDDLADALGLTLHALKNAIDRARKSGAPVTNHRQGVVRMEVRP